MSTCPPEIAELYGLPARRDFRYLAPRVIGATWRAGRIFDRQGLEGASLFLAKFAVESSEQATSALGQLQELAWRIRVVGRLLRGQQLCLSESIVVAAGLRVLGIPAEVVIGHVTSLSMNTDPVHAWVAVGDDLLIEDLLPGFYFELARYPTSQ